jgi:hypothetical protein
MTLAAIIAMLWEMVFQQIDKTGDLFSASALTILKIRI